MNNLILKNSLDMQVTKDEMYQEFLALIEQVYEAAPEVLTLQNYYDYYRVYCAGNKEGLKLKPNFEILNFNKRFL